MKQKDISPEEAMKKIQKIFKKRGTKALEMARKEILQERIECKEAKEALTYFMTQYWHELTRPSLLSLACEAVGGDPELTTPVAVPTILISGALDIHDDIIDKSKHKDGRPTVYGKFGKDIALLIGDALLFKGFTLLNQAFKQIPVDKMGAILNIIGDMFFELGDAEAMELQFRHRLDLKPDEYLRIVRKKGADAEAYMYIGALLGDASENDLIALGKYGRILGMLAILRDDLIDMIDYQETVHRIQHECLPLPLLYALQDSKVKTQISSILLEKEKTRKNVELIRKFSRRAGAFNESKRVMHKLIDEGVQSLDAASNKHAQSELRLLLDCAMIF